MEGTITLKSSLLRVALSDLLLVVGTWFHMLLVSNCFGPFQPNSGIFSFGSKGWTYKYALEAIVVR